MKNKIPMTAEELYSSMAAIVEAPGYAYLQAYKNDFYVHDKSVILGEFAPGSVYLWVVNPSGTQLTRIGVHPKQNEWVIAAIKSGLSSTELGAEIYLISESGVRKITELQAKAALEKWHFRVVAKEVRDATGEFLATFEVRKFYLCGNPYTHVMFETGRLESLTKGQLLALRDIGSCESVLACSSLFAKVEAMTINGHPIHDVINPTHATTGVAVTCD